jgi:predicted outer membrane lipoprotein
VLGSWFFVWFLGIFLASDKSVQASIIAAAASLFGIIFAFWKERSRSIKEAHRDKKIEIYQKYYDLMFDMLDQSKKESLPKEFDSDAPIVKRLAEVAKGALFYGSPKVIKALADLKTPHNEPSDKLAVFRPTGKLLLAMREDIGLSNRGLDEINIHQIYVSDDLKALGSQ